QRDSSRALYDRALGVLAGGVNSSVRASRPYPVFIDHGDGGHVVDVDGHRYLDFLMGYGPLLLGHDLPPSVREAVDAAITAGPMYGVPTPAEVDLAEFVAAHVPSVEMLRFVNSGTEATVSAVRLARAVTGRDLVVIMQGGYHGAQESTLVEGDATAVEPSSPGIPSAFSASTVPVPFNDTAAIDAVFDAHGDRIAAVMTEPILANNGIIEPDPGYLAHLRTLTDHHDALLIFDEVITGFRIGGLECAQGLFGVTPDLTTFGKIIGGGFPVGAVGGPATLIEHFTPAGDVFQSGTFSGHPVTMAAGLATLEYAAENDVYEHLASLGDRLRSGLIDIVADVAPSYTVVGRGSMFKILFSRAPTAAPVRCLHLTGCRRSEACARRERCPADAGDVRAGATDRWERIFRPAMRDAGILLPPNQFESQFLCAAHTEADVDTALDAYQELL
ncbi:UNVERIFIED_CONTAM: glutamate-1-semialdehyde aminotransferase, partial [Euhalothece sp. KZN 001]